MIRNILNIIKQSTSSQKIMTINEVDKYWSEFSQQYTKFDYAPLTFYYSLTSMMQLHQANNILQVACGTGKLIPFGLSLKNKNCHYLATDLSSSMVGLAEKNLENYFNNYQSKLTYQQWCHEQKIRFEVANGELPIASQSQFDRIICNCCLMLTQNPLKMLKTLNASCKPGGLIGLSVWGDKSKNNFFQSIRQSIIEAGCELPNQRSNFHLHGKVQQLLAESGWKVILNWQQNALFPVLELSLKEQSGLIFHQVQKMPQKYQKAIKQKLIAKIQKILDSKKGLNFSCQLVIAQKSN